MVAGFASAVAAGTFLLWLPPMTSEPGGRFADVRGVVRGIVLISFAIEAVTWAFLFPRFLFATVGLSTGTTADLHPIAKLVLAMLMFLGRIGPLTLGSAIALRERRILFELPKEGPAIG